MTEPITADDVAWIKREAEHCRRMEYTEEAQRFERIHAALAAQGMPSEGPRPKGSGALSTGKPGPKDAPNPSPSPAAGR